MLRHADRAVLCFLLLWQTWAHPPIRAAPALAPCTSCTPGEKHVFGKYFDSTGNDMVNSLYVWRPEGASPHSPAVVYFHPGGFSSMKPYTESNDVINSWTHSGFVYISVGYRLTPTKYYYNDTDGSQKLEEFIELQANGGLKLNLDGKTMADWQVYAGRQDVITKCIYDATVSMDWMVEHQQLLGIDPMKFVFQTGSAGTGISNYLTYTYQRLFPGRMHTAALIFSSAQLDYPVEGILSQAMILIADTMAEGWKTPLSDFIDHSSCYQELSNVACPETPVHGPASHTDWQYDLCNASWNHHRMTKYCDSDGFENKTLGDLALDEISYQKIPWPAWGDDINVADQHQHLGSRIWEVSTAIKSFPQGADFVYVANKLNGTSTMDLPHMPSWARSYANLCERVGCQYAVYYTDYTGMKMPPPNSKVIFGEQANPFRGTSTWMKWNYESSFGWQYMLQQDYDDVQVNSQEEMVLFGCFAVGMQCNTSGYDFGTGVKMRLYEKDLPSFIRRAPQPLAFVATAGASLLFLTCVFATYRRRSYSKLPLQQHLQGFEENDHTEA